MAACPIHAQEICDDYGNCVELTTAAPRIISLYGALNEMLLALDCADLIVARTNADGEIKEIAHLPPIGTHMQPNPELIVAARPDIILQLSGRGKALLQTNNLRKLGYNILCFDITDFAQL